ncbi:MAG: TonB-dependent receptor [Terracidiphilus sp.]|nr:TonB-dependent receptor [Terracidiphilus sp.]
MVACALLLLPLNFTFAQQAGSCLWKGILRNPAGAPIAGAHLALSGQGRTAHAQSQTDGTFQLPALPAGSYRLTVEVNGRNITAPQPVELSADSRPSSLILSDRGELTVTEMKSTQATGGEELSSQAVSELPLNKRDFGTLLLLAAGTMTDSNGSTNYTAQYAINGQRGVEAVFAMDGADISDPEMGGATFSNFNVDAVEAIESSSGWMPAEIGRGAAGFTNIVTRSGASGFHGSFFEFVRNSAFDARNYFDHETPAYPGRIPPFRRNEFGFTNGGPVYAPHLYDGRARSFYFVQYQGFRQVLGTTQVMPVPTATERAGTDTLTFSDGTTDTLTVPVASGIAKVLARYPLPNLPTGSYGEHTYATASKVATDADQFSLRIDHKFTRRDQFFARFTLDNLSGPTTNPDQTALDPSFAVNYLDRERNVMARSTHTFTPRLAADLLFSIERSTPGFPTPNQTDPAVKFNDSLFEAFNSAAGTVTQAYGNLFQLAGSATYTARRHAVKLGVEARENRDSTYYGVSPNGEYDFGGGTSYAAAAIPSKSGKHNIAVGDALPDTLSAFLSGSPFNYVISIAPPYFSNGEHIGPAAISRTNVNAYVQDTWKLAPRLTLNYGIRWEFYTPISERARRTAGFQYNGGVQQYVVNPQPGYRKEWRAWAPRVQVAWQAKDNLQLHAGGGLTTIPPNIWQNNYLTGAAPFAVMPRLISAKTAPIAYGFTITPAQLPRTYSTSGADIFASGKTSDVAASTPMDVDRYEQAIAALTPGHVVSDLALNGMSPDFGNATMATWTAGLERKFGNLTANANYVGTTAWKLSRTRFPNAYPGADANHAKRTTFDSAGNVTGGYGFESEIASTAHSIYHALQASLSGTVGHGGPGIQASYTWGKSIDDTSQVIGGTGSTGAVAQGFPQNPFDNHPERGPSSFDVNHSFGLSAAQDLHLKSVGFLRPIGQKFTDGWELLSISSISSGSPFTIFSGVQQTGAGSNGVDRPDQIATPHLSTARKDRADYFGQGTSNATAFFSIPIHVAGGTGPNLGRFGTVGRNSYRGPAYYDFDFSLIKDTPFGHRKSGAERMDLQFRSEFFNVFNIVNMGLPTNTLTGSGFGEISKTSGSSRQIQLSLKLVY